MFSADLKYIENQMINKFRDSFLLETVVFVSGAIVMIYEIIGSRILAPYIGTSTYVWTSLIGVILGSLSLGYWLGGKMADRRPSSKVLASVLFIASLLVTITLLLQEIFLFVLATFSMRLEFKAVIAALVLFAPASVLFGFVTPYAIRLKMESVENAGKTVGRLYALSTVGSILGTFVAGFVLLPFVGSVRTLYLIIAVLFALSVLLVPFKLNAKSVAVLLLFLLGIGANEFIRYSLLKYYSLRDFDTQYSRIRVWDSNNTPNRRPVRVLSTDPFSTQSSMYLDGDDMASRYLAYYHLLRHFKPDFQKTLNIGGAGYSFPKDYVKKYPGKEIDVVELDPQVTQIARDYFRLKEDENLRSFNEDGRTFLNQNQEKYDAIVMDAFGSLFSVPFQLTTIEAVRKINSSLSDDGVVLVNLISAIEGDNSYFLQAEYKTYTEVFPNVALFRLAPGGTGTQNLILVASKAPKMSFETQDAELAPLLKNRYTESIAMNVPVLTDDLAPVEYYNSFAQKYTSLSEDKLKSRLLSLINRILGKS